jgi:hypothetical protein
MSRTLQAATIALSVSLLVSSSAAAFELRPGTWEEVETGTEDGKPVPARTETNCMTPEEAKDPLKGLSPDKDMKGHCRTFDLKRSATGFSMRMECGDPRQFSMSIAAAYTFVSPTRYTGTFKTATSMMGKTSTSDKKVDARWLSAHCKK